MAEICDVCGGAPHDPCEKCGRIVHLGEWCFCPHGFSRSSAAQPFAAVVVFKAPDGTYRFPGSPDGRMASRYTRQGYTRVELRSLPEVRRFTATMNGMERSRIDRAVERRQQYRAAREDVCRSELRQQMQQMSTLGRDVARAAMARNDARPIRGFDPGCHFEFAEYDHSNRDEARRPDGSRHHD